ncbi:gibberellin 3-beta-dioxygenase 1-like [Cucurbita pepo subsp. pepo]|uniref:gibberellin 3-beta-dioxygenase 1-like n=2 Tax=Cucurbita pepo subsp. pepo TaxID=3664 RepID=UPI000C9DA275|nr:gibberellin 3-beta-dioxygenase 1-like [Cucurbita pepo subsp. pepo]
MADKEFLPLDFNSVQTVPESHLWPDSDELSSVIDLDEKISLPSIDLLDDGASELLGRACEQWGMFQLTNHGISKTLIAKMEEEARRLFTLPAKEKMKTLRSADRVTGYGTAVISKYHSKCMWHEGFTILGSPADDAKKLWPSDSKRFCDVMEEYQSEMKRLSDRLIKLIFKFLDISEEETMKLLSSMDDSGKSYTALQLNSYPPCPDPDQVMGLAAHTDTSLFTIVHQACNDGLQIFKDKAGWIPLSPMRGSFVVNVGDLLHIMSNGRFRSILHRVTIQGKKVHRFSLAYFYYPPPYLYITPHCKALSESPQTPLYRCVSVKEYFTMKAKNNGEGLSTIKI